MSSYRASHEYRKKMNAMQVGDALVIAESAAATPEDGSEDVEESQTISSIYHKWTAHVFAEFGWLRIRTSLGLVRCFQTREPLYHM